MAHAIILVLLLAVILDIFLRIRLGSIQNSIEDLERKNLMQSKIISSLRDWIEKHHNESHS
jgi:cell division protein FtsL